MRMLSDDDLDLVGLSEDELAKAWDLWFDLAQTTNDSDPPFTHGSLAYVEFPLEQMVGHTMAAQHRDARSDAAPTEDDGAAG